MAQETDVQRRDLTKPIRQVRDGTEMTIKFPNSCRGIASISSAPRATLPPQVCSPPQFLLLSLTLSLIVLGVSLLHCTYLIVD